MDGDPAVEPELDSFSLTLPLPYRVAIGIVLGVWGWGANLHYLSLNTIDVPSLIRYPSRPSPRTDIPHHLSAYRLATILTIPLILSLLLFWGLSHRSPTLVIFYDFLPLSLLFLLLLIIISPLRYFSLSGRRRFLSILRRISLGSIAQATDGKFGDILLADALTSYAKLIADLFVSLCMFFSAPGSATARPDRGCGGQYLVPIIIAMPSLIRFRQCIIEYLRVHKSLKHKGGNGSTGWGGQHLANALKYSTAFPVIIFSALQRNLSVNHTTISLSEAALYRCWLVAMIINSGYSFYWDVAKDWDLTLFSSPSLGQRYPAGLRARLYFPSPSLYYSAIILDFILRCTWSLKLSPHLDHFADFESGIFLLELAEVGRRWIWIFLRVETEWGRTMNERGGRFGTDGVLGGLGVPGPDDVLLRDYGNGSGSGSDND